MATRPPPQIGNRQAGVRSGDSAGVPGAGWSLFGSEFGYWVSIVSLILIILLFLIPFVLHLTVRLDTQLKRNEALILRLDEKEKKRNEKPRADPVPPGPDGL